VKLYIETVGCQMNVLDSELVVGSLRRLGYQLTDEPTEADVVSSTPARCASTPRTRSTRPGAPASLQRGRPDAVIGVLGCMAQKDQERILRRAPMWTSSAGPANSPASPN